MQRKMGGETVLHEAVWSGSKEIVRILLHHGANIEAKTNQRQTALYHATRWGSGEVVRILLHHGANIEAKTNEGKTARDLAVERENELVVHLIDQTLQVRAEPLSNFTSPLPGSVLRCARNLAERQMKN
jgi:ankyrin repeat protein